MDRREEKTSSATIDPSVPIPPRPERTPDELEPTHVTRGGRFWEITLPPDLEEGLHVSRF